jgi:predicted TIM-barrel fold metal-dependent hydrolase
MQQTVAPAASDLSRPKDDKALSLIDCDAHNYPNSMDDLMPYMSERWKAYIKGSGFKIPSASIYPKVFELASRRDSWPPNGKRPGSDPDFAREQLLDTWNIDCAILNPLYGLSFVYNIDLANALMSAANDWTAEAWLEADPRWRGSIVVNVQDPQTSAAEIRRRAKDRRFVQVLLLVRSHAPYGRREFHPIFEAASDLGLPIGIHFGGGGNPITACGWPSYYIEDHTGMSQAFEAQVISLVCEGVFEKFPQTRVVLIEGGFAWLPALMWRLDKNYRGLRSEVPWLTKFPSDYIREHFRATTQPMEEPQNPKHLLDIIDMIGRNDFLLFATDYPHWDFDAPDHALPSFIPDGMRRRIMSSNAYEFYDFNRT